MPPASQPLACTRRSLWRDDMRFVPEPHARPKGESPRLARPAVRRRAGLRRAFQRCLVTGAHVGDRYLDVAALTHPEDAALAPLRIHALYRLGCYRSVVEAITPALEAVAIRSPSLAQALATSLAASGRLELAAGLVAATAPGRRGQPVAVARLARALAPFQPKLAATIMAPLDMASGLGLALAEVGGDRDRAQRLLVRALAEGRDRREPDIHLLAANLSDNPDARRAGLARHLATFGLAPPTDAPGTPPAPVLLRTDPAAAPPGSVRGPLVTVIMPAFRTSWRIGAAIASLQAQTWADLEILVVDDASRDSTPDTVAAIAALDPRVRLMRLPVNGGPYVARNRALATARGEFVTCHDSDDWAHPERIARQMQPLLRSQARVFSTSNWVRADDDGVFYARPVYPLSRLNPASILFRRSAVLERAGYWEEGRMGADTEFFNRLLLVFGEGARAALRQTLTVGSHRPGSLMTAPETGLQRGPMMPARLAYWEAWRARHIALRREQLLGTLAGRIAGV